MSYKCASCNRTNTGMYILQGRGLVVPIEEVKSVDDVEEVIDYIEAEEPLVYIVLCHPCLYYNEGVFCGSTN